MPCFRRSQAFHKKNSHLLWYTTDSMQSHIPHLCPKCSEPLTGMLYCSRCGEQHLLKDVGTERELSKTLKLLSKYRKEDHLEETIAAFAHGEATGDDPLRSTAVLSSEDREEIRLRFFREYRPAAFS